MRTLVLLRGAPGSGKSTFIRNNNLEDWTISADKIRLLFQSPVTTITGEKEISQKNDNRVWDFIYTLMEERMKRGEFVIIDATHSRSLWVARYKDMVSKYRYRVYCVEFTPPLDVLLSQNKMRPVLYQVPEEYVKKSYEFVKTDKLQSWINIITQEELLEMVTGEIKPFDFSEYTKIHHIGDLHGCLAPLQEYVNSVGGVKDDEMWIFVGDYTDRGIQNGELLRYLINNFMGKKNALFLEGNHENWVRMWANGEPIESIKSKEFKFHTMYELQKENLDMGTVREFYRRIGQIAFYKYGENIIFVNHAGCPLPPTLLTTTEEYVKGVGKYEDVVTIENTFNNKTPVNYYQIHGHRNIDLLPIRNGRCFNLSDNIERGGNLRIVLLDKDGFHETLIKNTIFKPEEEYLSQEISVNNITEKPIITQLIENSNIVKKNLGDNIVSFNFSRDVFYDKKWNDITTKARGLFVNVNTGKIVARAWDKFFNIDEVTETQYTNLKKNMEPFPVAAYVKENGFLGIVGYNEENDSLFISSKSTNAGDYAGMVKNVLEEIGFNFDKAKEICKENNISLNFEIIHPQLDPHIIKYEKPSAILLNAVYNEFDYRNIAYSNLLEMGKELNVPCKVEAETFGNWQEFSDWYSEIEGNYEYTFNGKPVEGFVIECPNKFMFKIKTEYYKVWKKMRGALVRLQKGQLFNTSFLNNPKEIEIFYFIKNKPIEELKNKSIIQIREEYESQNKEK